MLRYLTSGESHGQGITVIIEGIPANLKVDIDKINGELFKRQSGYGRGGRMKIETDKAEIFSGVRAGLTTGAPVTMIVYNKDYENWRDIIGYYAADTQAKKVTKVRPGHADLAGCIKYGQKDARNILERASARETSARVAAGALCKQMLSEIGITLASQVLSIGGVKCSDTPSDVETILAKTSGSVLLTADENAEKEMIKLIDKAKERGDTLGGRIELIAAGMPVGVGSHIQYDRKLDYIVSGHLASVQAVKSVSIGAGEEYESKTGSQIHDEIFFEDGGIFRKTNNSGGIEGGISNGEDIVVRAVIKPIPTLMKGLSTVDIITGEKCTAATERSDVCAVPAAAVVCENALALALSMAILNDFGSDNMDELKDRVLKRRQAANDFIGK